MFFLLSKGLSFITSPSFWIFVLLLLSAIFYKKRISKKLAISAFAQFIIFTNSAIFYCVSKHWEEPYLRQPTPQMQFNYGIVLGGMAEFDTISSRIQFAQSADRLFQALPLIKNGIIDTLIISGGSAKIFQKERFEAAFLKEYCISIGIDSSKILIDSLSRNTYENAMYVSKLVGKGEDKRILLITSSSHLPRAMGCFRKYGLNIVGFGADPMTPATTPSFDEYFIPSLINLNNWSRLIHEWVGYGTYWITGKI